MEDDYITYEQAKDLKELGFPQLPTSQESKLYEKCVPYVFDTSGHYSSDIWNEEYYTVVPLSIVQKWLRKEKEIHIRISQTECIHAKTREEWISYNYSLLKNAQLLYNPYDKVYKSYERALSVAINKCIEILKNDKI